MINTQFNSSPSLNISIGLSILCYGLWGIFDKKAIAQAPYQDVVATLYLARLINIPITVGILILFYPSWHLSPEIIFWALCATAANLIGTLANTIAMSMCEASYVLGVTAGYNVIFQFLAMAWLGESLVTERLIGAAIITFGIAAIGVSGKGKQAFPKGKNLVTTIICLTTATFCWGLAGIFDKKAISIAHPFEFALAGGLCELIMIAGFLFFYVRHKAERPNLTRLSTWKFCTMSAATWLIGNYSYLFAFTISSASYVIAMTSSYPLVMYLFALTLLKESVNRLRIFGIILVTFGTILVQCTQSIH